MNTITRAEEEVNRVRNWAIEKVDEGGSNFPGMSYEQGVERALAWILGASDDAPDGG